MVRQYRRTVVRVEVVPQSLVRRAACRYHTSCWPRSTASIAHVSAEGGLEVGTLTRLSLGPDQYSPSTNCVNSTTIFFLVPILCEQPDHPRSVALHKVEREAVPAGWFGCSA